METETDMAQDGDENMGRKRQIHRQLFEEFPWLHTKAKRGQKEMKVSEIFRENNIGSDTEKNICEATIKTEAGDCGPGRNTN